MRQLALILALATSLLLGGCATTRNDKAAPSAGTVAPEPAPRAAPAVAVPAGSGRTVVLAMTGPQHVVEAKDWAEFKREWRETFADHARNAGIAFSFVDGAAAPQGKDGTLLLVNVADYRNVGVGSRIMLGVMTGNAYIDARVQFASLRDGKAFGEQQYNTSSSAWGGVFSKVTPQQVDSIAADVFKTLITAR